MLSSLAISTPVRFGSAAILILLRCSSWHFLISSQRANSFDAYETVRSHYFMIWFQVRCRRGLTRRSDERTTRAEGGVVANAPNRGRPRQLMIQSERNREAFTNDEMPSGPNVPAL